MQGALRPVRHPVHLLNRAAHWIRYEFIWADRLNTNPYTLLVLSFKLECSLIPFGLSISPLIDIDLNNHRSEDSAVKHCLYDLIADIYLVKIIDKLIAYE